MIRKLTVQIRRCGVSPIYFHGDSLRSGSWQTGSRVLLLYVLSSFWTSPQRLEPEVEAGWVLLQSVMLITPDPPPHNPVGFRCSVRIWCELLMRTPVRPGDTSSYSVMLYISTHRRPLVQSNRLGGTNCCVMMDKTLKGLLHPAELIMQVWRCVHLRRGLQD